MLRIAYYLLKMKKLLLLTSVLGLSLSFTGCETMTGTGALVGAGGGTALGALIGHDARSAGIGAIVGSLGGAAAGKLFEQHDSTLASNDGRGLPYGRRVDGNVTESPYTGRLVDTTGLPHGSVVRDPEARRNFIKP